MIQQTHKTEKGKLEILNLIPELNQTIKNKKFSSDSSAENTLEINNYLDSKESKSKDSNSVDNNH